MLRSQITFSLLRVSGNREIFERNIFLDSARSDMLTILEFLLYIVYCDLADLFIFSMRSQGILFLIFC